MRVLTLSKSMARQEDYIISAANFANLMGVSKAILKTWEQNGTYVPSTNEKGEKFFDLRKLTHIPRVKEMLSSSWEEEARTQPLRPYSSIELFAGAGGLALGMEFAGFEHVLLSELDADACRTLKSNRPHWEVAQGDIKNLDFRGYRGQIDLLTGGFPCQAFSYAGKQGGFADTRGTLFFELARAVEECRPRVLMAENVKGLLSHDSGRTLQAIRDRIHDLGYTLIDPRVLQAIMYRVPQKRERLILIAIRNDLAEHASYRWPAPYTKVMTLRDALFSGELYLDDVPKSAGASYPSHKKAVLDLVPMGGYWRDLPELIQRKYMKGSYDLPGGKTGMARRLTLEEPSLTLTCSPAQKQTERCHPIETRPLSVREYARIQTFPDTWQFCGSLSSQYKQIGNAVPVNLSWAIGRSLIRLLNTLE